MSFIGTIIVMQAQLLACRFNLIIDKILRVG